MDDFNSNKLLLRKDKNFEHDTSALKYILNAEVKNLQTYSNINDKTLITEPMHNAEEMRDQTSHLRQDYVKVLFLCLIASTGSLVLTHLE